MAKFLGNGVVWDAARNKELCSFVGGVFVTDDVRTAETLRKLGYVEDKDVSASGAAPSVVEELLADDPITPLAKQDLLPASKRTTSKGGKK